MLKNDVNINQASIKYDTVKPFKKYYNINLLNFSGAKLELPNYAKANDVKIWWI